MATVLAQQRASFMRQDAPTLMERRSDLMRLRQALLARRSEFAASIDADFGHRSAYETSIMELVPLVHGIDYLRRNLRRWMRPERRRVALHFRPATARVVHQPLGVVGIIAPWNYPLSLSLMPLATAIAAGNRVMFKPSEFTPATTALLESMLHALFPDERVAVVTGGAEMGAAFAALPFDHLIFTGSTRVGRSVMRSAAENLVPVTLELGGKSPVFIEPGLALEDPAISIAYGKLANAGQTCIAPDYALVHENDVTPFVACYIQAVPRIRPTHPSTIRSTISGCLDCWRTPATKVPASSRSSRTSAPARGASVPWRRASSSMRRPIWQSRTMKFSGPCCRSCPIASWMTPSPTSTRGRVRSRSISSVTTAACGGGCWSERSAAMSPSTTRCCILRRMTCRSAASEPAAWVLITAGKGSWL
jgi:hypothetical protein